MLDRININQTLHGYADGHRQLACSTQLSKEDESLMLILSDMSGPIMVSGFEEYISGYPLKGSDLYVLSKTWYAKEMSRPGCVWTHSLLINKNDFIYFKSFFQLQKQFMRPSADQFDYYRKPIVINHSDALEANDSLPILSFDTTIPRWQILHLLKALYDDTTSQPVYISSPNSRQYQDLVLNAWNQMWPQLKVCFSFCTGSLSDRKYSDKSFDLQIIPTSLSSQLRRSSNQASFLYAEEAIEKKEPWLDIVADNFSGFGTSNLRDFLWTYGPDFKGNRNAFSTLAKLFVAIEAVNARKLTYSQLLNILSGLSPNPSEAITLKAEILHGMADPNSRLIKDANVSDAVQWLLTDNKFEAFAMPVSNINQIAEKLWKNYRSDALNVLKKLLNSDINPLGGEFLSALAQALTGDEVVSLYKQNTNAFYTLVKLNPLLSVSSSIFKNIRSYDRELFSIAASSPNLTVNDKKTITTALLDEGIDIADDVVSQFGSGAVVATLDWVNSSDSNKLTYSWRRVLAGCPSAVMAWLSEVNNAKIETVITASDLLDANSMQTAPTLNSWIKYAQNSSLLEVSREEKVRFLAFILTIGFNNREIEASELVSLSFQHVHDAAASNELSYDSWRPLEKHAPSLSWFRDWDKCERLRAALVNKFIDNNWPANFLLKSIKRTDTYSLVVDYCKKTHRGKKLLMQLVNTRSLDKNQ